MASEGNKIQRKETLNRHIPHYNVDSVAWHVFEWQKYLRSPLTIDICTRRTRILIPSHEDRYSTVTALRYITRKSCTKNASIVPFPNLASMLLSVQIAKIYIPSVALINDENSPAFRKLLLLHSSINCFSLEDWGHSMFKSKGLFFLFQDLPKTEYFHDAQLSTSRRSEWHSIWVSLSLSRQVHGPYNQSTAYTAC